MKIISKSSVYTLALAVCVSIVGLSVSSCGGEEEITFSADVSTVFDTNCKGCHETGANYAPVFSSYADIKDKSMNGTLMDRIQSDTNPMPPAGKMADEDIQLFLDWAEDGYLE
ncbi:MAG: hypothetical protein ACPGLV_02275 [Bacteroidia bacterium]